MNKEEIIFWKSRYDDEEDRYTTGLEKELRKKFQKSKLVTKSDLIEIVKWKFQGRLLGRRKRILNLLNAVGDSFIREKSKLAFEIQDDKERLKLLSSIYGVGNALSSVILTFYDPDNYGVLDIHAWRGLFGKEPANVFTSYENAIKFFNKLREISSKTSLSCRDIEKALFKKDLEISTKLKKIKTLNKSLKQPEELGGVFLPKGFKERFDIIFIAEMPSMNEPKDFSIKNENFNFNVTKRDKFFQRMMVKYGVGGSYVTDIVKERNIPRKPTGKEIKKWLPFLLEEIDIIKPKAIIVLGKRTYEQSFELYVKPKIPKTIKKVDYVFHYSSQVPRKKFEQRFREAINRFK